MRRSVSSSTRRRNVMSPVGRSWQASRISAVRPSRPVSSRSSDSLGGHASAPVRIQIRQAEHFALPPHAWAIARCPLRAASSTDSPVAQSIVMLSGRDRSVGTCSFSAGSPVPFSNSKDRYLQRVYRPSRLWDQLTCQFRPQKFDPTVAAQEAPHDIDVGRIVLVSPVS